MENKKEPLEKEIQNSICEYLEARKFMFWRSNNVPVFAKNNGGKYQYRSLPKYTPRGLPDIMVIVDGKFIAIEVKRKGAKLRPEQAMFGMKLQQHNAIYIVANCIEDLLNIPELNRI